MDFDFFPVHYNSIDNNIRIYGIREGYARPVMIQVSRYPSTLFVANHNLSDWTVSARSKLLEEIKKILHGVDPVSVRTVGKRVLMGAHIDKDGKHKSFLFLELKFAKEEAVRKVEYMLTKVGVNLGHGIVKLGVHHHWIDLWYQFSLVQNLPITNWLHISNATREIGSRQTICDEEYSVKFDCVGRINNPPPPPDIPTLAYDIEVYSAVRTLFPKATRETDQVFQISMIMGNFVILLTRGHVDKEKLVARFPGRDVEVFEATSEMRLLSEFTNVLMRLQPLIIIGYNNMKFDGPYMIERAKGFANCLNSFERQTMHSYLPAKEFEIKWSSTARQDQNFSFMKGEGFTMVDLLTLVQGDYKLSSYKLDYVAEHFLNKKKDDVPYYKVFEAYELAQTNPSSTAAIEAMTLVGAYCLQDSQLVLDLFSNLKFLSGLLALSFVTNCKMEDLSVRGAQHKVVSNIVRFCHDNGFVINRPQKNSYDSRDSYRGAVVWDPVLGVHQKVVSFDFKSLYPSLMMANNFCPSTLVSPESDIPDSKCLVMEWEDHVQCQHDDRWNSMKSLQAKSNELRKKASNEADPVAHREYVDIVNQLSIMGKYKPGKYFCNKRKFRWVKEDVYAGVYPKILEKLLDDRASVRKQLKQKKQEMDARKNELSLCNGDKTRIDNEVETIRLHNEIVALNARQLAIKLLANSLYGFTGSASSPIPCVAIAMCTTYAGRTIIRESSKIIEEQFGGITIYGDTDSNYVKFPSVTTYKELNDLSIRVAKYVSDQFHRHLTIEYEETIYDKWLIVGKKQYCYLVLNEDGTTKDKLDAKGLLLVRRDNCTWVRSTYSAFVNMVFKHDEPPINALIDLVLEKALHLLTRQVSLKDLIVTKSVGSWGDGDGIVDQDGKTRVGKYVMPKLPSCTSERNKLLASKGFANIQEFWYSSLPGHVRLAVTMNNRGTMVVPGERIQYVIIGPTMYGSPKCARFEDPKWVEANPSTSQVDYLYYINILATAVDTVLSAIKRVELLQKTDGKKYTCKCKVRRSKVGRMCDEDIFPNSSVDSISDHYKVVKRCLFCKLSIQYDSDKRSGTYIAPIVSQMARKVRLQCELLSLFSPRIVTV